MTPRLIQFSSVVAGQAHNPTILNPDFLAVQGIVPRSWGWEVAETLTSPPFSVVRYSNGVAITVEPTKLQVTDPNVEGGPERSKITEIASSYVRTLPHVHYSAAGDNYQSIVQLADPEGYLKARFLKSGPWDNATRSLNALGVRLIFPLDGGRLTLSIDSGEAKLPNDASEQSVIITNANFNRNCVDNSPAEQVVTFLEMAMIDWADYQQLLSDILAEMPNDA